MDALIYGAVSLSYLDGRFTTRPERVVTVGLSGNVYFKGGAPDSFFDGLALQVTFDGDGDGRSRLFGCSPGGCLATL